MNEPLVFQVSSPIPSKKNSRVVLKNGVNIPSKEFRSWHKAHLCELRKARSEHGVFTCPVSISLGIAFGDRRRRDLDNALTSVIDLVKDSGIIVDDDWQHVTRVCSEVLDTRADYAIVTVAPSNVIQR